MAISSPTPLIVAPPQVVRPHETELSSAAQCAPTPVEPARDRAALSHEAQNLRKLRQMASELVGRLHGDLSPAGQLTLTTALEQTARVRYGDQLAKGLLSADVLEGWLRLVNTNG